MATATTSASTDSATNAANLSRARANHANQLLLQTDPLHRACKAGNWQETKQLIESCGATRQARCRYVNRRDANGSSPIFHCVWYGYYRVLSLLVHHGANPNLQNNRRNTALHLVCEQLHWSCAGLLIQAGARIDIINWEGKTCTQSIPSTHPDAAAFLQYMQSQQQLYAREHALKTDLFAAINSNVADPSTPSSTKHSRTNSVSSVPNTAVVEFESIRRLCWSVHHLQKGSCDSDAAAALRRGTTNSGTTPTVDEASEQSTLHAFSAVRGFTFHGRTGSDAEDPRHATLDPDLLVPIREAERGAMQQQASGPASTLPSSSISVNHPPPLHLSSASSSTASLAAATISAATKHHLKNALHTMHHLSLQYPQSNLGPGYECRRDSAPAGANPHDAASAPPGHQGPTLSYHGLSHLVNHLATHWPGLPLPYKKYMLAYLIRISSNLRNACCLVSSTRPIVDGWVNNRPNEQSVLMRLVDAVLDWLELSRGLSSCETDCSLLPSSRTFQSVSAALGMIPATAQPPHPNAINTTHQNSTTINPTPRAAPQPSASSSPTHMSSVPGPSSVPQPLTQRSSNSRPASASAAASSAAGTNSSPTAVSNYIDDYEIASLVLELVASILSTLRLNGASVTPEMVTGGTHADEERMREAVAREELAINGRFKSYTSGGGGGYGSLAVVSHAGVELFGSAAKEGVHDAPTDRQLLEHERVMEQKIARRATVAHFTRTSFSPRSCEVASGNLRADLSPGRAASRGVNVDRTTVHLWRSLVRLFEHHQSSSVMRLLAVCMRAPFPPNVHPLVSLRVLYLLKEGFQFQKTWHPLGADAFRTEEVITYTMLCIKNIQYLRRPPQVLAQKRRAKDFWKTAFSRIANQPLAAVPQGLQGVLTTSEPSPRTKAAAEATSKSERRFQDIVLAAARNARNAEKKNSTPVVAPTDQSSTDPDTQIAGERTLPAPTPETAREHDAIIGLKGVDEQRSTGAAPLLTRLTGEERAAAAAAALANKPVAPSLPPHFHTEALAEPLSHTQVPYSPRFSLNPSTSLTALELSSPTIVAATTMPTVIQPQRQRRDRPVLGRLLSSTEASRSKVKMSTKEFVMQQVTLEKEMRESEAKRRSEEEANTVQKIADPMKFGGDSLFNSTDGDGSSSAAMLPFGKTGVSARSASSLPDFFGAATIAHRMMLVDRCMDFLLSVVLDSATRAQELEARKLRASRKRAQEDTESQQQQAAEEKMRGLEPGTLAKKNLNPRAPDPIDIVHESTGHRTLKGLNDLYGPPPLTTLCCSLMDWGVIDSILMLLSPLNQSLSCHRHLNRPDADPTNTEGVVLLTTDDENIAVFQALQSLCYLLRMDACIDLIYMSPHALCIYALLSTTADEHVANSILYVLSHLLRKRRWNERLMHLRGRNPNLFLTREEQAAEEAAEAARATKAQLDREASKAQNGETQGQQSQQPQPPGEITEEGDSTSYVALEYLLMKWARLAVHLSLSCLPLKPWSTLPRSSLLRHIPTRPSELPMKMLVYRPLDAESQLAADQAHYANELEERANEEAKRRRRIEEEQEAMGRNFLATIKGTTNDADQATTDTTETPALLHAPRPSSQPSSPPESSFRPPSTNSSTPSSFVSNPLAREHATSSSAIPREQSWFALHYTPPTEEQKAYVRNLQRYQQKKMNGSPQAMTPKQHSWQTNSDPERGSDATLTSLSHLTLKEAQVHAALSASGLALPFTPLASFDSSAESESRAGRLYEQSHSHRMGGTAPIESSVPRAHDANVLVVEQFLAHLASPVAKARTLQQISRTASGRNSPSIADIAQEARADRILSPVTRSLQQRIDQAPNNPSRVGSVLPSPRGPDSARAVPPLSLSQLAAAQDAAAASAAASRAASHRTKGASAANSSRTDRSQAIVVARATDTDSDDEAANESGTSSDDDDNDGASLTSGSHDSHTAEQRRLEKVASKTARALQLRRTEEARERVRSAQAEQQLQQRSSLSVQIPGATPRRLRLTDLAALRTASAMPSSLEPHRDSPRSHAESNNAVVGGKTSLPSFSNIALSESILYRLVHCFFGFARHQRDAERLLECGAIEFVSGLINHPVFDISLHAIKLLTQLTSRFSEEFLVQMMEVLVRSHISNCWLGISIGRTDDGSEAGFPWCGLDDIVTSCADLLRVDVTFQPRPMGSRSPRHATMSASSSTSSMSSPHQVPPQRDERSVLAFQLLVNLCQDPKGRGYAAVKKQSVWHENLLHDVLSHPSLRDLEDRQKRFRQRSHYIVNTDGFPFTEEQRRPETGSKGERQTPVATPSRLSRTPSRTQTRTASPLSPPSRLGSRSGTRTDLHRSDSLLAVSSTASTPNSRPRSGPTSPLTKSRSFNFLTPPSTNTNSMRPNAKSKVMRPTTPLAATGANQGMVSPPSKLMVIPVTPFGGHWNTQGGVPYDRRYAGGTGLPAYAHTDSAGRRLPTADGLDWEIPSASAPGSTELLDLLADAQLSTQSVDLRVCALRSCGAVEHTVNTFVLCPRCMQVAYCCKSHRTIAYKSWHKHACSVVLKKKMKPNQTLRYPVRLTQRQMHSTLPTAIRQALLSEEMPPEAFVPQTDIV